MISYIQGGPGGDQDAMVWGRGGLHLMLHCLDQNDSALMWSCTSRDSILIKLLEGRSHVNVSLTGRGWSHFNVSVMDEGEPLMFC